MRVLQAAGYKHFGVFTARRRLKFDGGVSPLHRKSESSRPKVTPQEIGKLLKKKTIQSSKITPKISKVPKRGEENHFRSDTACTDVMIRGLKRAPQYNGELGNIIGEPEQGARWLVQSRHSQISDPLRLLCS